MLKFWFLKTQLIRPCKGLGTILRMDFLVLLVVPGPYGALLVLQRFAGWEAVFRAKRANEESWMLMLELRNSCCSRRNSESQTVVCDGRSFPW